MNDYIDKKIFENNLLNNGEKNYKIFNKIKKIFILGILLFVGFISFGNCDLITYPNIEGTYTLPTSARNREIITNGQTVCVYGVLYDLFGAYDGHPQQGGTQISSVNEGEIYCSTVDYWIRNNSTMNLTVLYGTKPITSSLECQTEYNLIPVSSVNQNYCVNNGLCPSGGGDCPVCPGTGDNWSALYINNIQHLSAPIINVDIPEEFDWDYSNTGGVFDLTIDGYNTDSDYIAGIITTQNSKPTNEDLNNIITNVIPLFVPGLVIILFIYFVFRFLKKIF